jgi:hypothetical protein
MFPGVQQDEDIGHLAFSGLMIPFLARRSSDEEGKKPKRIGKSRDGINTWTAEGA